MPETVFVFGSNLAGQHGGGSAAAAHAAWGALMGVGVGPTGSAYAIPTLDEHYQKLPLDVIAQHVRDFVAYAAARPSVRFETVAIGCGIAGFTVAEMAPLFAGAPDNVVFLDPAFGAAVRHGQ